MILFLEFCNEEMDKVILDMVSFLEFLVRVVYFDFFRESENSFKKY